MNDSKILRGASVAAVGCVLACAAAAQPAPEDPPRDVVFFAAGAAGVTPFGGAVDVIGGEGAVLGGVVKDKPYTADSVTESTQTLADGNRITHRNESRVFRDSQGRTRREQTLSGLGMWQTGAEPVTIVTINDPVADASYILDPRARTARKVQQLRVALDAGATWTKAVPAAGAAGVGVPAPADGPGTATVGRRVLAENGVIVSDVIVGTPPDASGEPPAPFELPLPPPPPSIVTRGAVAGVIGSGPGAPAFATAPITVSAFGFPGAQRATEDLGDQVLEGVLAHGTRETQTIPAGAIGNERPIAIVAEQWYSKDIEAVVLRRNSDPRFGETTYRLVNLVRSEPAPDLFTVPPGYELETPQGPLFDVRSFAPGERAELAPPPGVTRGENRVFFVQPGAPAPAK
jgi:hypothetical protein